MGLNPALTQVIDQPDLTAVVAMDFTRMHANSEQPLSVSPSQVSVLRQRTFEGRAHPAVDSTALSMGLARLESAPSENSTAIMLFLASRTGSTGQWATVSMTGRGVTDSNPYEQLILAPAPYGLAVGILITDHSWLQVSLELPDGTTISDSGDTALLAVAPIESSPSSGWADSEAPLLTLRDRNGSHIAPPFRLTIPEKP